MPERGEDTGDIRSHCLPDEQFWVGSSRNWSVFLGEGPNTGCHKKAAFVVYAAGWLYSTVPHGCRLTMLMGKSDAGRGK